MLIHNIHYTVLFLSSLHYASGQLVNGQFFTHGLAISDSPAPQSELHAGSKINIAVELSGDGHLPQEAFLPTSKASTAYQSLNIYLVSAEIKANITVSEGPSLLEGEPGSTVKHLNWEIPSCVLPGNYNITYYELSRIDNKLYYSITPIPVCIQSNSTSPCPDTKEPESQPQAESPYPNGHPWLSPQTTTTTVVSTQRITTTVQGSVTVSTVVSSWSSVTTGLLPTDGTFFPANKIDDSSGSWAVGTFYVYVIVLLSSCVVCI